METREETAVRLCEDRLESPLTGRGEATAQKRELDNDTFYE